MKNYQKLVDDGVWGSHHCCGYRLWKARPLNNQQISIYETAIGLLKADYRREHKGNHSNIQRDVKRGNENFSRGVTRG